MKKIGDYRKLLGVTKTVELKDLKTIYRNMMKDCHPDKFFDNAELKAQAEIKSQEIIEAYHFLVSINPETLEQTREHFEVTLATSQIADYNYEKQTLKVIYADSSCYEFFGVPYNTYVKMVNSDSMARFVRRHIAGSFTYRSASKQVAV